jgi:hypothetical protein
MRIFILAIGLTMLMGCAAKKQAGTNLLIPMACLTKPVQMIGCDDSNPPKCLKAIVTYHKACAMVDAPK